MLTSIQKCRKVEYAILCRAEQATRPRRLTPVHVTLVTTRVTRTNSHLANNALDVLDVHVLGQSVGGLALARVQPVLQPVPQQPRRQRHRRERQRKALRRAAGLSARWQCVALSKVLGQLGNRVT